MDGNPADFYGTRIKYESTNKKSKAPAMLAAGAFVV
jgi:hypothetical protein